jgi:hypothetical protein
MLNQEMARLRAIKADGCASNGIAEVHEVRGGIGETR